MIPQMIDTPPQGVSTIPFSQAAVQARQQMDEVASLAPRLGGLQPPQQPGQAPGGLGGPEGAPPSPAGPAGVMPPQQMPAPPQPDPGQMPMQPQGPMPPPSGEPAPLPPGGGDMPAQEQGMVQEDGSDGPPPNLDQALAQLSQRYLAGGPGAQQ